MLLVASAVGAYYLWGVRAVGHGFDWRSDLNGYYDELGRAFTHRQLHLLITPLPQLLALPNPWDPAGDNSLKLFDSALYNGRYYLYHGAGPAVMLFTPWRILTGHDLPENFALFLLCFGGFLFCCGSLLRILSLAEVRAGPVMLALIFLALGLCQSIPFLLNRVWVYEIAIGSGYFCFAAAWYFLLQSIGPSRRAGWLAASGLMFGMAVASRPNLVLGVVVAGIALGISLIRTRSQDSSDGRTFAAFLIPLAAVGVLVAIYNYQRFGNPFEFGVRYLLTGPHQNRIKLAFANMATGLYYMVFCRPDFSAVFPWVLMAYRSPFNSPGHPFPSEYYLEPIVGALFLAPFAVAAFVVPKAIETLRILLWALPVVVVVLLLFHISTGMSSPRYEVDFLPWAVLAALANLAILSYRSTRIRRAILHSILALTILVGAFTNLAIAISGPIDEMRKTRPAGFVRLARWLSPVEKFRPLLNPRLDARFSIRLGPEADGTREPLLTMGSPPWRHVVYAEHLGGKLRIVSESAASTLFREMPDPGEKPIRVHVLFSPETHVLTTSIDGHDILRHKIDTLLTAPSQVEIGRNSLDAIVTLPGS